MSFRSPLASLTVANMVDAGAVGNAVNQRFPWESGQVPVLLGASLNAVDTTGVDTQAPWHSQRSSFALNPIGTTGSGGPPGSWKVPNGYRLRLNALAVLAHTAGATGFAGIKIDNNAEWALQTPYHAPNNSQINVGGFEIPGGTVISFWGKNFGTATYIDAALTGVCYLP